LLFKKEKSQTKKQNLQYEKKKFTKSKKVGIHIHTEHTTQCMLVFKHWWSLWHAYVKFSTNFHTNWALSDELFAIIESPKGASDPKKKFHLWITVAAIN